MFTSKLIYHAIGQSISQGNAASEADTVRFSSVQTDSRKAAPGSLFVALKGDLFDGHDFIEAAISRGATGVICREDYRVLSRPDLTIFRVQDTLDAYRRVAHAWRLRFSCPVIGVAGSVGKTTTKELLASMLTGRFERVLKTAGSQNGFIGIPMTLLELRPEHQAAVIEIGIDEIGAMTQHLNLVRPDFSVVTAIGAEHLEKLLDLRTVAREEALALTQVYDAGGTVAINCGDEWICPLAQKLSGPHALRYQSLKSGESVGRGVTTTDTLVGQVSPDGTRIECSGRIRESFELPLRGFHNASNFLSALSLALAAGLTPAEIRTGLQGFKPAAGRSEIRELPGPTPVICDYYNANPSSMSAGLELLQEVGRTRIRWACLGDMLELGTNEELLHRQLAPKIIESKVDHVLLFGPRMRALQTELQSSEFSGKVSHFDSHEELAQELLAQAKPRDAILIKGSRGMKMEEIWVRLEAHARTLWSTTH